MKRVYNGVKAEPKFLRDPTSFESISSGISRLSGYVASNLSKRRQSAPVEHYVPFQPIQDEPAAEEEDQEEPADTITFATFSKLNIQNDTRNCLLLGYQDGFQVWDISNPDDIHELCSIRNEKMFGTVTFIHYLISKQEPVLVIVSEADIKSETPNESRHPRRDSFKGYTRSCPSIVKIYSLKSQEIIKEISEFDKDEDTQVTCIKSNHKVIALGCLSQNRSSIQLLSITDFNPVTNPLTDVYHDNGPIFTLGTRFIAYATNTAVLNSDPVMSALTNKGIGYTGIGVLQGEKDMKGAAKDIAKEVASGMKSLGELGYSRLSNYFSGSNSSNIQQQHDLLQREHLVTSTSTSSSTTSTTTSSVSTGITSSISASPATVTTKKSMPMGMIMIRDLQKLNLYNNNNNNNNSTSHNNSHSNSNTTTSKSYNINSSSVIAHFRPHTHAISCLSFNPAGTLLLSASKQGHTFHVFSILSTSSTAQVVHLYSLSRGITDAQVVDCQFSLDSTWCAVSTARGTTHIYAINPYGGKPDINSHVHNKVNNQHQQYHHLHHALYNNSNNNNNNKSNNHNNQHTKAVTLNSIIRIKQRRKMPLNETLNEEPMMMTHYPYYNNVPTSPPQYIPGMNNNNNANSNSNSKKKNSRTIKEPRAKITTMFTCIPKSSNILNLNPPSLKSQRHNSSILGTNSSNKQSTSLGSMLSSFGSNLPYTTPKWLTDKSNDPLMFGFDEEYDDDDSTMMTGAGSGGNKMMMMNDEIGHQDIYSFHPDGILTLHRCWVAKTIVRKRESGRVLDKSDFSIKEEDVAEWRVARNSEWDQVVLNLSVNNNNRQKATIKGKPLENTITTSTSTSASSLYYNNNNNIMTTTKRWLSNAEINTYPVDRPALWTYHQFSFQTYQNNNKDLQRILNAGIVPPTNKIVLQKGIPEPISSRLDRVRKTFTRNGNTTATTTTNNSHTLDDDVNENLDDALAELEDNISKAMQTSFSPSNSIGNSPSSFKWISSSANAVSPSTPRSLMDRKASVSFEDAYLINMASDPMQHSSLIQFDDNDDDDVIRLEEGAEESRKRDDKKVTKEQQQQEIRMFSPDGDNEIASPSDSFFGGNFGQGKTW